MLLAMAGAFGSALLFIMALIALVISGTYYFAYLAHCFTTVVQDTAAGNDEVIWPDELLIDWIHGVVTFVWLIAVWLAPLGLLLQTTKPAVVAEYPVLRVILGGFVLWLFFPIGILSSLASSSRWAFLHWRIVFGMFRLAPATVLYYAATLLVVAIGLGSWILAFILFPLALIPVAAFVGSVAILIYGRLLGRLAHQISILQPLKRVKPRVREPLPPLEVELVQVADPWKAPVVRQRKQPSEQITENNDIPIAPKPLPISESRPNVIEDEWEEGGTYSVGSESTRTGPTQTELYETPPEPIEEEAEEEEPTSRRRRKKRKGKSKSKRTALKQTAGILLFPFYVTSRRSLAQLTIMGAFVGAVLYAFLLMLPS